MVTGWVTDKSGNRYYFGKDGKAVTGKHKIKGTNYYFNQNGALTHTGLNYNISSDCALLMNADTGKIYNVQKMKNVGTCKCQHHEDHDLYSRA